MSTKVSAFPPSPALVLTDIFPVVVDPGGVPLHKRATFTQLQTLLATGGPFVLKAGDTMTGALAIGNGSLVASTPYLNLSQTWNNGAVVFTGLLSNITNTASDGNSNFFNFQIDGSDRFTFTNNGQLTAVRQGLTNSGFGLTLRKRGSSVSATGLVTNNSTLANVNFSGWDGVAFATGNSIRSIVQADWSAANHGAQLTFITIPTGSITEVTALTLSGTDVVLGVALRTPYVATAIAYLATSLDFTINCTSGTFTVSLPTAVGITGRIYVVKNSGAGTVTIDPAGAELIDGAATATVVAGAAAMIQSNGAGWLII